MAPTSHPRTATPAIRLSDNMPKQSRRDFIKLTTAGLLTASGLLGIAGLFHYLDYQSEPPIKTEFDLGPQEKYPIGSRTLLLDIPTMLFHNDNGFKAMSLVCTHLGCTVEQKDNGFTCPCHGSQYTLDGTVQRGPAQKPLRTLRLEINANGHLIVHTD